VILFVCSFGVVNVLVFSAFGCVGTLVACPWRPVTPAALGLLKELALAQAGLLGAEALSGAKDWLPVSVPPPEFPVLADLFGDGALIFPNGLCNSYFGRSILDARLDNLPLVQGQVSIVVQLLPFHFLYPFAAARVGHCLSM
jgi:hypothetical protein